MNYRQLGNSGLKVSEICLGAWINFGGKMEDTATFAVLDAAIEEGIDFFDTADVYAGGKAEEVMGPLDAGQRPADDHHRYQSARPDVARRQRRGDFPENT